MIIIVVIHSIHYHNYYTIHSIDYALYIVASIVLYNMVLVLVVPGRILFTKWVRPCEGAAFRLHY
jgi:hypothetical protein